MKGILILFLGLFYFTSQNTQAQPHQKQIAAVNKLLSTQAADWNRGDIPAYMQGYWQSDSLVFIGKSGLKRGWKNTLANYTKSYPNAEAMGKLDFKELNIEIINHKTAYVIGRWHLSRSIGDVGGSFTLLVKKINGKWLVVADHSS